jgi:hypothetical protein
VTGVRAARAGGGGVRVVTVPGTHAYVEAVRPVDVVRVDAPVVSPDPWAPSELWDQEVLTALADGIDVVHVHFGFDHLEPAELRAWTTRLAALGVPLVLTVHDLRNPHHLDRQRHDAHLDVLVPAATAVLTLTPGAAAEIAERWGVRATVVPHPAVTSALPGVQTVPGLVGVHLKSLRRNVIEPARVVQAVLDGVRSGGGSLRVDVHPDVVQRPELAPVRALATAGELELAVHGRLDDRELAASLQQLHVCVLPHRFGTHSGWLEACRDVGTAVVAPSCGFYAEQWADVRTAVHDEVHGLQEGSLSRAVAQALASAPSPPADPAWRAEQLHAVRHTHAEVYARCAP